MQGAAATDETRLQAIKSARGAMSVLAMVAMAHPDTAVDQLDTILEVQSSLCSPLPTKSTMAALCIQCAAVR